MFVKYSMKKKKRLHCPRSLKNNGLNTEVSLLRASESLPYADGQFQQDGVNNIICLDLISVSYYEAFFDCTNPEWYPHLSFIILSPHLAFALVLLMIISYLLLLTYVLVLCPTSDVISHCN